MASSPSISEMMQHSRAVLRERSVAAFERYEKLGTLQNAVTYVAIAAAISGVLSLVQGPGAFLINVLGTVLGFVVFVYIVHWWGSRRGGTGTLDEVAYSFALFWAPLAVLSAAAALLLVITLVGVLLLPALLIVMLVANVWFAYLATQASLNLPPGRSTWLVLIVAGLMAFLVNIVIGIALA